LEIIIIKNSAWK